MLRNYHALNLLLDKVILALVTENDMDLLRAVATNVRACLQQTHSLKVGIFTPTFIAVACRAVTYQT